jgi:hypothetical protein
MLLKVRSYHVGAIVHPINYDNCERISEYHAKLYDRRGANDPIIESVTITTHIGGRER